MTEKLKILGIGNRLGFWVTIPVKNYLQFLLVQSTLQSPRDNGLWTQDALCFVWLCLVVKKLGLPWAAPTFSLK